MRHRVLWLVRLQIGGRLPHLLPLTLLTLLLLGLVVVLVLTTLLGRATRLSVQVPRKVASLWPLTPIVPITWMTLRPLLLASRVLRVWRCPRRLETPLSAPLTLWWTPLIAVTPVKSSLKLPPLRAALV